MALSIDWITQVITVPKADMTLISAGPPEVRELDVDAFRLELKSIEASEEGMPYLDTHRHNTTVTVGGVTLARVVEIINGYSVTFEDGSYVVSLAGANNNVLDVLNLNSVQVRSANSAGLVHQQELEDVAFANSVWLDTGSAFSGTSYPNGTPTNPVNNIADALAIASAKHLNTIQFVGSLTLSAGQDISGLTFVGQNPDRDMITLSGGGNTGTFFVGVKVVGTMSGSLVRADRSYLGSVTGWDGDAFSCQIIGPVTLDPSATGTKAFIDCASYVPGTGRPTIDVNGAACDLSVRRYAGGLNIENITQPASSSSFDFSSGTLDIKSTCTAGVAVVRGPCDLQDSSGASFTVVRDGVLFQTGGL